MRTEITINGSSNPSVNYISWAPVPSQIRLADPDGATTPVAVRLKNQNPSQGGQIVFFAAVPGTGQDELPLSLPVDSSPVNFFIAGKFRQPSTADRDAVIETTN